LDAPTLPQGQLLYAIGDIHGRSDLLAMLLARIEADAARREGKTRRTLIFIGDYIDRGPDSSGVIEILLNGLPSGFDVHFLKGNHEAIMLDFLADPSRLGQWLANGAEATLKSYGVDVDTLVQKRARPEAWREDFLAAMPERHRSFFESLELMVPIGDYLFVHAGVRPGVPLAAQDPHDLIWIRGEFLRADDDFGKVVVHGHTPTSVPDVRANRIGIDTGAVFTGRLTALRLEDGARGLVQTEA
jgi:diadenosine tetraphosphatase ApaH/serine/threonine PP2A family protein phosphatase